MSSTSLCRLCICSYTECKNLLDEFGQKNYVYEIAEKYFDTLFLNSQQHPQLSMVICMECWEHINDFHAFQQLVLNAQSNLEQEYKPFLMDIKIEGEGDELEGTEPSFNTRTPSEVQLYPDIFKNLSMEAKNKNEEFLSNSDTTDDNPFSTDDENPLINCLPKIERKKRHRKFKKEDSSDEDGIQVNIIRKQGNENNIETTSKTKADLKRKIKSNELADTVQIEPGRENTAKDTDVTLENNCNDSNQSSNDDDDYDNDPDYNDNDNNNQQADPDAFVSFNYKQIIPDKDVFIAEWKQTLECDVCNKAYTNFALLRTHFSTEHPKQKCYVSCCQRQLKCRVAIVDHIRYHRDPNTFKCKICDKVFKNTRTISKHMYEKHTAEGQERSFECTICQKRFAQKSRLKTHMGTHDTAKDYKCNECGKGFSTEQRRKIHERTVHQCDRVCDQCGKTIHGVYAFRNHKLAHSGLKKRKWPCDQCNTQPNSRYDLKRHKEAVHSDGSTIYVCSECGKIAPSESALQSHKKYAHQAEHKFKCTICDKGFKVAILLSEHMATHTGEELY